MRKIILIILINIFFFQFLIVSAEAQEKSLVLTATASSSYNTRLYPPSKAVDGDVSTYWLGGWTGPWWIMFDAGSIRSVSKIVIKWLDPYYGVEDYDIQISSDGTNWQDIFSGIIATYDPNGEIRQINSDAQYIRLYINTVTNDFPVLREFEAYTISDFPNTLRFQAKLGDAAETPLDGVFNLIFRLYDVDTAGTPLWEEIQQGIDVVGGILDVELGSVTTLDLPFDVQYWLGVEVESDGEMTPRFKLTSVPYSFSNVQ